MGASIGPTWHGRHSMYGRRNIQGRHVWHIRHDRHDRHVWHIRHGRHVLAPLRATKA